MDTLTASVSVPFHQQLEDYDEMSMQEFILFDDSVKDLKNLRTQLYSAAEYFELSYTNDNQEQIVVDTLKDYTVKALVNTVDHLGSVTYKVNNVIDGKVDEVSGTELLVSCIEQRLKTCREYTDREGLAQQSSIIDTPRYHKRYILPAREVIEEAKEDNLKYHVCTLEDENDQHKSAAHTTRKDIPSSSSLSLRKSRSISPSLRHSRTLPEKSSSSEYTRSKEQDRRCVSPQRYPLPHTGSLMQFPPLRPCKSASVRVHDERQQQQPSKSKRLFRSLLSRRKSKKDDMLYTYLDDCPTSRPPVHGKSFPVTT
ncbi:uncharacterized protein [Phyllobates terribilis]|uniref:uncharacterized protein n=1 Tax=Phyllobates terribilis TaxID=111132 RepID=UPI003CCB229E